MKIKLKESKKPHIKNIIFHINKNKDSKRFTVNNFFSNNDENLINKNTLLLETDYSNHFSSTNQMLINHSGLIPKNPTFRNVNINL